MTDDNAVFPLAVTCGMALAIVGAVVGALAWIARRIIR